MPCNLNRLHRAATHKVRRLVRGRNSDQVVPYITSSCAGSGNAVRSSTLKENTVTDREWCQVAGGIEDGETAWQTAVRELFEETGLKPNALYSDDICEQFYEPDRDAITMAPVFVAFVDASATVVLNHKHSDYRWVSFQEAIEMVAFGGQRRGSSLDRRRVRQTNPE